MQHCVNHRKNLRHCDPNTSLRGSDTIHWPTPLPVDNRLIECKAAAAHDSSRAPRAAWCYTPGGSINPRTMKTHAPCVCSMYVRREVRDTLSAVSHQLPPFRSHERCAGKDRTQCSRDAADHEVTGKSTQLFETATERRALYTLGATQGALRSSVVEGKRVGVNKETNMAYRPSYASHLCSAAGLYDGTAQKLSVR